MAKPSYVARITRTATIFLLLNAASLSRAEIIFESATSGPTGETQGSGVSIDVGAYLAVNFHIDETVITQSVGGHLIATINTEPLFAAIVRLDGLGDLVSLDDLESEKLLGATLIHPPIASDNVAGNLRTTLTPGWYALVMGSARFGATGDGGSFNNNTPDGESQFYSLRDDGTIIFQAPGARFFVDSFPVFELEKIIDAGSIIPGESQEFVGFLGVPSIRDSAVAFVGRGEFGSLARGVYFFEDGSLLRIADQGTPIPGAFSNFNIFEGDIGIQRGAVAFHGGAFSIVEGLYTTIGGSLQRIIDSTMNAPGSNTPMLFPPFHNAEVDGDTVSFLGSSGTPSQGVFKWHGGELDVVASTETTIPGTMLNFDLFDDTFAPIDGGNIAFAGGNEVEGLFGIYLADTDGTIQTLVDTTISLPELPNPEILGAVRYRRDRFAFIGAKEDLSFIAYYTNAGGTIEKLFSPGDAVPGESESILGFVMPAFDGRHSAVRTIGNGGVSAILTDMLGTFWPFMTEGDHAFGKKVTQIRFGSAGFDQRKLAIGLQFDDFTEGVYIGRYPRVPGDFDGDNDVDLADAARMLACTRGEFVPLENTSCRAADTNGDLDVDLSDLAGWVECTSGPADESGCHP